MIDYVLYGIPKGQTERYTEVILLSDASDSKRVEKIKQLASADGFHSFRVAKIDLGLVPDFGKTFQQ